MLVFCDDGHVNITCQDSDWIIDSGASYHVTPHRNFFSNYSKGDYGYVKMGNEASCKVIGMGDIYLYTNIGFQLLLNNIRHISDVRLNLVSTRKFEMRAITVLKRR